MRLYDLTSQYNDIADMLEGSDDREALQTMLDGLEEAFDAKVESIIKLMVSKAAERDAIDEEAQRLRKRAGNIDKEVDWLQTYVQNEMMRTGKEKVKSSLFKITLANCPPSVNVLNESEIPKKYKIIKQFESVDKRSILELLKSGVTIPGVEIIQRKSLRVR